MPKKARKGKKGKSKGKKGAKGGKAAGKGKGAKAERRENLVKMAKQNADIWETRLQLMDKSRVEYREAAKRLADENSALDDMLRRTEHDTIEVISHLKKQEQVKDDKIHHLTEEMKTLKLHHRKEKETLIKDMGYQMAQLEEQLAQKDNDIQLMQNELRMVKEFRRKRGQMQKELDEIKESLMATEKEHQNTLSQLERKFFEEKMRMQQEANQKISELAERAQSEAISNLDEASRSVFKENVRLSEALSVHMKEAEKLKGRCDRLRRERDTLRSDLELSESLMKDKVVKNQALEVKCKQLETKVETLEIGLNHMAREFQRKESDILARHAVEQDSAVKELAKLRHLLEMKSKEMAKVKLVAKAILEQRTDVEKFFVESLELVRKEIEFTQEQYRKDAQRAYTQKMLLAHAGKSDFPAVRTFRKNDASTNSVFMDMQAAERMKQEKLVEKLESQQSSGGKVDLSDLTWEQRERVLRLLFARMNHQSGPMESHQTGGGGGGGFPALTGPPQGAGLMRQYYSQQSVDDDQNRLHHLDETYLQKLLELQAEEDEEERLRASTQSNEPGSAADNVPTFVTQKSLSERLESSTSPTQYPRGVQQSPGAGSVHSNGTRGQGRPTSGHSTASSKHREQPLKLPPIEQKDGV